MYFGDYLGSLTRLLDLIKPGGIMLLHEQISRKSWGHLVGAVTGRQQKAYPEAHCVGFQQLFDFLSHRGLIVHKHLTGSPLRTAFIRFLDATQLERLRPLAAWVDSIWCAHGWSSAPRVGCSRSTTRVSKGLTARPRNFLFFHHEGRPFR